MTCSIACCIAHQRTHTHETHKHETHKHETHVHTQLDWYGYISWQCRAIVRKGKLEYTFRKTLWGDNGPNCEYK